MVVLLSVEVEVGVDILPLQPTVLAGLRFTEPAVGGAEAVRQSRLETYLQRLAER
jgi:hypothetical protein